MSQRGRPDLSPTQLVAGGLATATATVATSYLGVAGTLIGAAFMSVATTAGAAVYQYYIDRGKRRYVTMVTSEIKGRFAGAATAAEPAGPAEPPTEPPKSEDAAATVVMAAVGPAEPNEPSEPAPDEVGGTRAEPAISNKVTDEPVARPRPVRRPRWYVLAGAAFTIFAVVIGTITAVESLANKPVSAMLGKSRGSGTSLGETFGGGGPAPTQQPVAPSSSVPASPSGTASSIPSEGPTEPGTAPVAPPPISQSASPSATATTRPPAPTPEPSGQPTAP